jgi:hypothetical protein
MGRMRLNGQEMSRCLAWKYRLSQMTTRLFQKEEGDKLTHEAVECTVKMLYMGEVYERSLM